MARKRLLIVSEDSALRETVSAWLDRAGFVIDLAQESEVAAELCESNDYAAVVVDFDMAQVKAYETILFLRAIGRDGMSIALVSGDNDRLNALICGATAVLAKPVSMKSLESLIARGKPLSSDPPLYHTLEKPSTDTYSSGDGLSRPPLSIMGGI